MAEVVCELGVKSPKKHQNTKSHNGNNNNIPENFINKNSKKDNEKQLTNKAVQLDSETFKTNISSQKLKDNYKDEGKGKNITAVGGPSKNHSPYSLKGDEENKKDHVKYNKELVNGFDKICSTNAKTTDKSKEHDKKVKSKKGKSDSNNKKETEDVLDLQQSFQDLTVDSSSQVNKAANCHKDGKEGETTSKKSTKYKERKKEIENALRRDLQQARNKFWSSYFQKRPAELLVLTFHKMNELQKVDLKQQHAQFKCGVCQYYCNSMAVVTKHIREERHNKNIKKLLDNYTVKVIPKLPTSHTDVQTEMLENLYTQYGMTENDSTIRQAIVKYIDELIQKELSGCSARMFGSSVHRLGLKSSDLNIDLRVGENWVASNALCHVAELIKKNLAFRRVKTNFTEKIPSVVFMHMESKVNCVISLNNERPVLLAALIAKYTHIHPVLPRLTTVFRLWGKLAQVDQQDRGLWPAYALYLLVIFFLQHCEEPVLPVLSDFVSDSACNNPSQNDNENACSNENVLKLDIDEVKSKWQSTNTQTLGELWVNLLKFYASNCDSPDYVVSIDNSEPKFRQPKRINIVDPFMPKRNVTRTVTCASLYNYIAHCLKTTYKYFGVPQTRQGPIFGNIAEELVAPEKYQYLKDVFVAHNSTTSQFVRLITLIDKNYFLDDITEEEAYRTAAHVINSKRQSFVNLNNVNVKLIERAYPNDGQYKNLIVSPQDAHCLIYQVDPTMLEYKFNRSTFTGDMAVPLVCEVCKEEGHIKDDCPTEELSPLEKLPPVDKKMLFLLDALCSEVFEKWIPDTWELHKRDEIVCLLQKYISSIYPTAVLTLFGSSKNGFGSRRSDLDICLTFNEEDARKGLKAPAFIEKLGAQLKKCPGLKNLLIISSAKVPIIKFEHAESKLEGDISLYNILGQENTQLLRSYTEIDSRVTPLGFMMKKFAKHCHIGDASKGGLSSYAYSLMVIYFLQHSSPPVLPVLQEVMKKAFSKLLKFHRQFAHYHYMFLFCANVLAVINCVHHYIFLSSILNFPLLHYLNKLHEGDGPCPEVLIDGCNTYYYKDIHKLNEVWKDRQKNTSSVGHLWLQLLRFYTEIFDIENHVISIRTSKSVTKFEKLWISKCIAIEDPFDVAHNLGSALSRNMNIFIIKALRKGRQTFGTPIHYIPNHSSIQALYFNTAEFQVTSPPNDRGCRFCKTIGHVVRDCPAKQAVAERKSTQKKNKRSKENTAATSEDSKESENSLAKSDSDSSSEMDSAESAEDNMSPIDNDNSSPEQRTIKIIYNKPDYSQPSSANPPLDGPTHSKFITVKLPSTNNQIQQQNSAGASLVRTQNLPGSSSHNRIQEKYYEDIAHTYGIPYHNVMQSKDMQHSPVTAGNQGSGERPPVHIKLGESEGGAFQTSVEIPQTLVYTNSNFKQEFHMVDILPPTHTASFQIPGSVVYTNTGNRSGAYVHPAERDQSHEMMISFTEIQQQQRFTSVIINRRSVSSGNEQRISQYEKIGLIPPASSSAVGFSHANPLPMPAMRPMLVSPPLSGADPRLGPPLVRCMNNPGPSVQRMSSMPAVNNNFPRYGVYDNAYPFFTPVQNPQPTSTVTIRNVQNSAQCYEDSPHAVAGLNKPVPPNVVDSSDQHLPPFSVFKMPNSASQLMPAAAKSGSSRHRSRPEYVELEQLDKRAKLLTGSKEYTEQPCCSKDIAYAASAKKMQKEKKLYKRGGNIAKKEMKEESPLEMQVAGENKTVPTTDSNSSDGHIF